METIKTLINKLKEQDKLLHFLVNLFSTILFGLILGIIYGICIPILISIGKEAYDYFRPNGTGWDWNDIIADVIGILLGIFIIL